MMPDKQEITIKQNLLDKFEIRAMIKGKSYKGERATMNEAFSAADDLVRKTAPETLKIVKREAKWHGQPPSDAQMRLLLKLYNGKQIPHDITKGQASKLIGAALAGKVKK